MTPRRWRSQSCGGASGRSQLVAGDGSALTRPPSPPASIHSSLPMPPGARCFAPPSSPPFWFFPTIAMAHARRPGSAPATRGRPLYPTPRHPIRNSAPVGFVIHHPPSPTAGAPTRSGQPEPQVATTRTPADPACSQRVCHTEGPETAPRTHHLATDTPITVAARPHPPRPSPTRSASPSPAAAPAAPGPSSSSIRVAPRATPSPARRATPARPVPSS